MSAVPADVFSDIAYAAPSATLVNSAGKAVEDKAFSAEGRLGVLSFNARYWLALLIMFASTLPLLVSGMMAGESQPNSIVMMGGLAIFAVGLVASLVYMSMSTIKRLHDLDYGGWNYLRVLIPIYGAFFFCYISLKSAPAEGNRFGVTKPVTKAEKIGGTVGIVFSVLLLLGQAAQVIMVSLAMVGGLPSA